MPDSGELGRPRLLVAAVMAVLLVAVFAVIWALPDLPARRSSPTTLPAEVVGTTRVARDVLFVALVLLIVFVVSTFAFLRWSRHFRRWMLRKPHSPTPASDVWSMHRVPDEADADPDDDELDEPDEDEGEDDEGPDFPESADDDPDHGPG